mgnify:CR=1 FL=1|jgi:transcriptional regulator, ArsR family
MIPESEKNDEMEQSMVDEDIVAKVRERMPEEEPLYDLAELFKVFGDSTRIRIIWALFEADMSVSDIANLLNMTQSAISHQLRVLKNARLVKYKKSGKAVYYSLNDEHIKKIFELGMDHIME